MSDEEEVSYILRLPKRLKDQYQRLARNKGLSLKAFILNAMEQYVHPLPVIEPTLSREVKAENEKIASLQAQKAELYEQDEHIRGLIAKEIRAIPQAQRIQEKIWRLLIYSTEPLSELSIAADPSVKEDADIIYVILSYLEQNKVIFTENHKHYKITNKRMMWRAEETD